MNKANQSTLDKRVEYTEKDDESQTAAGVVMVPDKVDLQGDFAREDLIREWATQFENFLEAGEGDGGIMHAAWPSEWMTLERNEVLDEAEELGGETVEAGAWVQEWQYNDDELWSLVSDGVFSGHSIGATNVTWSPAMAQEELPDDVDVAADYPADQPVWQIQAGLMREVSAVDMPAVPDAEILTAAAKAGAAKRLGDHLGSRDGFIQEAMERGHPEEDAERMWSVLHRATDVEGAGDPGKRSALERLGKAVRDVITPRSGASEEPFGGTEASAKDGDHGFIRPSAEGDGQANKDDTGGDTPDDDGGSTAATDTNTMSDDTNDDPFDDAPEWAKELRDGQEENNKRIDEALEEKGAGNDDPFDDAPEWAKRLKENQDKNAERIDEISKQTGATESQQLGGTEKGNGSDEKNSGFTLDPRKAGGN
ncbi:hypothetical protein HALG_00005 [Halorubrum virus CGphi46]|uniref:Phage-like element PBSX protein XkdF domain-containing protein n=1 Tax=Halorubrum virus CGphi46 TaxID=754066 RepID=R9TLS3_9CAUD|nr:hypothetical protein HALG_00005 [Halorubrum virus CGphi46]AGN33793.1 hypothetical protein HALG_00005 [Halorubrum virus CGphi46]